MPYHIHALKLLSVLQVSNSLNIAMESAIAGGSEIDNTVIKRNSSNREERRGMREPILTITNTLALSISHQGLLLVHRNELLRRPSAVEVVD